MRLAALDSVGDDGPDEEAQDQEEIEATESIMGPGNDGEDAGPAGGSGRGFSKSVRTVQVGEGMARGWMQREDALERAKLWQRTEVQDPPGGESGREEGEESDSE